MTTNEIRKQFLDFFAAKGHTVVASDSLVPKNDPTVLFTTAGMQQFKRQFLGHIEGYTRAASSQKCLRTDDLERVGKTPYHHTFFEMLGNFSFGDYFKREAIEWAWEFLTQRMTIPAEKLWVSVYTEDTEAEKIWLEHVKIPKNRLVKLGDKSNFWPSEAKAKGPNGPCGPCSEIFYDYGTKAGCGKKNCSPACDCGRFSEVWNLVFTQFNRKDDGALEPLPNKNIDTGMGLERLAAVVQGKKNNFETDLFAPMLNTIDAEARKAKARISISERFLLADHVRAITIGIADGVVPSNEGRGYVMKRLIIDVTDIALRNGLTINLIKKLVPAVAKSMNDPYPELTEQCRHIVLVVEKIADAYVKVKKERVPELKRRVKEIKGQSTLPQQLGKMIFQYRDTYGLTLPAICSVATEAGINKNQWTNAINYYQNEMDQQKERSRAASKMAGDVFTDMDLDLDTKRTQFVGYDATEARGKILKIFNGSTNEEMKEAKKGDPVKIILDKTPFYAESGGQVGDTGSLAAKDAEVTVGDTVRIADIFIHHGEVKKGSVKTGDAVTASVDSKRRLAVMRNHTATHLLQAALRAVLGKHVQQQGSLVAEDRLRFDFTHPKALTRDELSRIEHTVNKNILSCDAVEKATMPLGEAKKHGALAFFAEKYAQTVRVVSIGGYSKELCGGTHLKTIGQIGLFKIVAESAIAQGIRRIEAVTGIHALALIESQKNTLEAIAHALKVPAELAMNRVNALTKKLKDTEKEIEQLHFAVMKHSLDAIIEKAPTHKGIKIVIHAFSNRGPNVLRACADTIKQKAKSCVVVLGSKSHEDAFVLVTITDDVLKKNVKASDLVNAIAPLIGGSGGGRPQMAQAGSKNPSKLGSALAEAETIIKEKL